jgi:purine-binding chemotaxis protein CheW
MNLRGTVVPVVDLGVKFGSAAMALTKWTCVVVVEVELDGEPTLMGLIADAVGEVIETSQHEIDPPPAFGTRIRVDYLTGMVRLGRKFVLILDIDRVLSVDELLSVESLLAQAEPGSPAKSSLPPATVCESVAEGRT